MATDATDFVRVADLDDLRASGRELVTTDGTAIALFHHEGEIRAVDNRCPHMGFPLSEGSVDDGILTCHWHHARFELSCGDTFDPWADDVQTYPVEVRDDEVYVNPNPARDKPPADHWADRLDVGLEENLRLVTAKSTIGLLDAGVDYREPVATTIDFGTRYTDSGWGSGLTILGCMANLLAMDDTGDRTRVGDGDDQNPVLDPEDRKRALYTGVRHVASDSAGETPAFDQPSFSTTTVGPDRLETWFRNCIEVRDADGAERCLRTAIAARHDDEQVAGMVVAAATDHPYLSTGHTLDFANKAFESLDHVGWDHAGNILASLVEPLATAARSDERSSWRQPVDLVALLADVYGGDVSETSGLVELVDESARTERNWHPPGDLQATILSDDPEAIVDELAGAIRDGASTVQLASEVARAATTRVAQFATANEFSDWNTVHHTFTYANAVCGFARRTDHPAVYRGVFDTAASVYLDRFLNTPPAPIPEPGDDETGRDPAVIREDLLECFDETGKVNEAGRLANEHGDCGGDFGALQRTLVHGLLREDAGFHTLQNVEAAFQQFALAETERDRRTPLIATARYLAAHTPTRREAEQTFTIASRLNRGEAVHENGD